MSDAVYRCRDCQKPVDASNMAKGSTPDFLMCVDCDEEYAEDQRRYEEMLAECEIEPPSHEAEL